MDSAAREELGRLRARAYGPAADIEQDPVAVQRLHELEGLHAGPDSAPSADSEPAAVPEIVKPDDQPAVEEKDAKPPQPRIEPATEPSETPKSDTVTRASSARLPIRWKLLWAASIVGSAALAASVTYGLVWMSPVPASAGAPQIATLEATSTAEVPSGFAGAGPSSSVFEFYGLTLFESAGGFGSYGSGVAGVKCVTAIATEQVPSEEEFDPSSWGINGPIYSGCAVGVFPASVAVGFDSNTPRELRERFPSGRALQFVLDGDRLGVFLDSE